MKSLLLFLLFSVSMFAQSKTELSVRGFSPVSSVKPDLPNEELIEITRGWADLYNKLKYDVYNVTANSVTVDGLKENAFFYRNRGEVFKYSVLYSMKVRFGAETISIEFAVKEIYADRVAIKSTLADYFAPDGTVKEGFEDVKTSMEKTANNIIQSYLKSIGVKS